MKHKLPYLRHMWKFKDGRFICLRRKCKAEKKVLVDPETSEECRLWEQNKPETKPSMPPNLTIKEDGSVTEKRATRGENG